MREIKFRGKRVDNGEWVYGDLINKDSSKSFIVMDCEITRSYDENFELWSYDWNEVIPETVGQFTGLYDSTKWESLTEKEKQDFLSNGNKQEDWKGRKIFEGDIISVYKDITEKCSYENAEEGIIEELEEVVYNIDIPNDVVKYKDSSFCLEEYYLETLKDDLEIIGNIHDNKDLL